LEESFTFFPKNFFPLWENLRPKVTVYFILDRFPTEKALQKFDDLTIQESARAKLIFRVWKSRIKNDEYDFVKG